MKTTFALILALLSFNASASQSFAAWQSFEATAIQKAKAQALIEGKKVLVRVGAGWCGPCAFLEELMAKDAAVLKPALDRYIQVDVEELHLELFFLTDFMAVDSFDFPNIYLIDPATDKTDNLALSAEDGAMYANTLNQFSGGMDLATEYQTLFRNRLKAGDQFGTAGSGATSWWILEQALNSGAHTQSDKDYAAFTAELREAAKNFPNQFVFDPSWGIPEHLNRYYNFAASRPSFDPAVAQSIDKAAFSDFSSGANEFYGYVYHFQTKLSRVYRSQGLVAAANACDAIRVAADQSYKGPDYYDKGTAATAREILCAELAYLAGTVTKADTLARYMALPQTERDLASKRPMGFFGAIGEFQSAILELEKVRARYAKSFATNPKMLARVNTALDARLKAFQAGAVHP